MNVNTVQLLNHYVELECGFGVYMNMYLHFEPKHNQDCVAPSSHPPGQKGVRDHINVVRKGDEENYEILTMT